MLLCLELRRKDNLHGLYRSSDGVMRYQHWWLLEMVNNLRFILIFIRSIVRILFPERRY